MADYIEKRFVETSTAAVYAGMGAKPVQYTKGGEYGRGSIAFADNPTATDTITLNGIWVEFSAAATDFGTAGTEVDPFILQIAVDLATTLTNLATALNGSANTSLAVATYDGSSGTSLAIVYDTLTADSQNYTLAASSDTPSGATLTGGQAAVAIVVDCEHVDVALTDTNDQYFTLADGKPFQRKTIAMSAKGTGNAVITPANYTNTTITLDTDGDFWSGIFLNGEWKTLVATATEA